MTRILQVFTRILSQSQQGGIRSFYLMDGLSSVRGLTNLSGQMTDTAVYDAFGTRIAATGSTTNAYGFAGEQFDATLGQYYLRDRYYDTSTGRFTRSDRFEGYLDNPMSRHGYLYTHANPVNFTDPSGIATGYV